MRFFLIGILLLCLIDSFAQNVESLRPQTGKIAPSGVTNLSDTTTADYDPVVTNVKEQPNPASGLSEKKALLLQQRMSSKNADVKKTLQEEEAIRCQFMSPVLMPTQLKELQTIITSPSATTE